MSSSTNQSSPSSRANSGVRYARYVGRVGALAISLGVGFAVATPGVALADSPDSTTQESPDAAANGPEETSKSSAELRQERRTERRRVLREVIERVRESASATSQGPRRPNRDADANHHPPGADVNGDATSTGVDGVATDDADDAVNVTVASGGGASRAGASGTRARKDAADVVRQLVSTAPVLRAPVVRQSVPRPVVTPRVQARIDDVSALDGAPQSSIAARTATGPTRTPSTRIAGILAPTPTPAPASVETPGVSRSVPLVSGFLAAVGLAPSLTPPVTPPPAPAPFAWAVLAFARREIEQQIHRIQRTFLNRTPVVAEDTVDTKEDTAVTISPLSNDSDPDGDPLKIASYTNPTQGTLVFNQQTNSFQYTPTSTAQAALAQGQTLTDEFTYTVTDVGGAPHVHGLYGLLTGRGHTSTQTVHITITGVNDPPTAAPDTASVGEDGPATTINLLEGDKDPDTGDTLTVTGISSGSTTAVAGQSLSLKYGSVTNNGNGTVTYTPDDRADALAAGKSDTETFTYTIKDSQGVTATSTVTVIVNGANDAPVARPDSAVVREDAGATVIDVLSNDLDPDRDDTRTVSIANGTGTLGTLAVGTDGKVRFTPNPDQIGPTEIKTETFQYTLRDATGAESSASVTVTVTGVNYRTGTVITTGEDRPVEVVFEDGDDDGYILNEDGTLTSVDYEDGAGWQIGAGVGIRDIHARDVALDADWAYIADDNGDIWQVDRLNPDIRWNLGSAVDEGRVVTDVALDANYAYAVDSGGTLTTIDRRTGQLVRTPTVRFFARSAEVADVAAVGTSPKLAVAGGKVYVANGNRVSVVNVRRQAVVSARMAADGVEADTELVAEYAGDLDVGLEAGDKLTAIDVADDGTLYATVVSEATTDLGARAAAVSNSRLMRVQVDAEGSVRSVSSVAVGRDAESIAINDRLDRAYVVSREDRRVSVIGLGDLDVIRTVEIEAGGAVAVAPTRDAVLVTHSDAHAVSVITDDPINIELDWGAAPRDLDAHLIGPNDTFHVSYRDPIYRVTTPDGTEEIGAFLNVDDRDGDGPEIIQIDTRTPGEYEFYVVNYSGETGFGNDTSVTVRDPRSGIEQTFYLSDATVEPETGTGRYWHVFTVTVSAAGTVTIDGQNALDNRNPDPNFPAPPGAEIDA